MSVMLAHTEEIVPHPTAPQTVEECGLSLDLILQLVLKTLHFAGELSGVELGRRLGLSYAVIAPALDLLKVQQQVQIVGGGLVGGASYRYRITDSGRTRAALFLESSHYVGVAPVPLSQYQRYMERFRAAAPRGASRDRVRQAFSHLVISDRVLDQLGPAINAAHSMFVYGPPGNGKTVISQAIRRMLDGHIAIPHALEVEGSIVRLFNPVNHEPISSLGHDAESLTMLGAEDRRWVTCRRPMVMVGGELTLDSLELSYSSTTGFYQAPVQAVANGGVLVIDDFGRQHCSPRDLLNRWIVPLESRVDFLTLQTGQKFEVPFMTLIVFATNIRPAELVDEAFLRRIQYKIFAESPTVEDFVTIFDGCCAELGVTAEPGVARRLLLEYYRPRKIALRGCHPRDLIRQALSLAGYLNRPPHVTMDLLEEACGSYFVDDREEPAVYA
jgi:predicted ATPase with chaperone activity